jgi:hypothetical protein
MHRHAWLACSLALFVVPLASSSNAPAARQACANLVAHEPIVVYEVTGYTVAGQLVDRSLAVYGDGLARISAAEDGGGAGRARIAYLSPATAASLQRDLASAGAFTLCDDPFPVADMPMSTLTVLRGATDAKARTYSWWWAQQTPYEPAEQVLASFIAAHFPGF